MTSIQRTTTAQIQKVSVKTLNYTRVYQIKNSSHACKVCTGVFEYRQTTGRPPDYCEGCRKEIRKQQNRENQRNRRKGISAAQPKAA